MAIYQGDFYAARFKFADNAGVAINITGWTFQAMLRAALADPAPLLTLTSANGGFLILDGPNGRLQLQITGTQALALPAGRVLFDVQRTDIIPGPTFQFGGYFLVKQPVTR